MLYSIVLNVYVVQYCSECVCYWQALLKGMSHINGLNIERAVCHVTRSTVFPRIVRARSINFTVWVMRGQFEGALYSRARSNSSRAVY